MSHNQLVFGVTLAAVLALCSFLLYRIFFNETNDGVTTASTGLNDGADIEATLKKILSQTATLAPSVAADGSSPAPGTPEQALEVEKLRAEITANQNLITELKTKATGGGGSGDPTPELLAKIKTLEDRLLEYEIIEDDIADLSIYKEENAKLKRELEALKAGSGEVLKNDAAVAAIDAVAAPVDPGQVQTPVSTPVESPAATPETPVPVVAAPEAPAPAPTPAPVAADPGPGSSTTVTSTENVKGSSDVFAEFQGDSNADILAGLGDLDADRMLEEIKDLGEAGGDAGVLDEDVDLEKMAKETSNKG
ncbi:MAG: hypothetical protein AABZ31_03460 [Bdellovibrionota bacterium]